MMVSFAPSHDGLKAMLSYKIKIKNQNALKKFSCSLQVFRENLRTSWLAFSLPGNKSWVRYSHLPISSESVSEQKAVRNKDPGNPVRKAVIRLTLSTLLLTLSFPAQAQQSVKVLRIGFLDSSSRSSESAYVEAFRQGLHELGYVEGKNIIIDYRYAEGQSDRLPAFVADLVDLKVDVLVTLVRPATVAAKGATKTIPIVTCWGPCWRWAC